MTASRELYMRWIRVLVRRRWALWAIALVLTAVFSTLQANFPDFRITMLFIARPLWAEICWPIALAFWLALYLVERRQRTTDF